MYETKGEKAILHVLQKKVGVPLEYEWSTVGVRVEYEWSISGVPAEYQWSIIGVRVEYESGFFPLGCITFTIHSDFFCIRICLYLSRKK
jgi:hypothetical protein